MKKSILLLGFLLGYASSGFHAQTTLVECQQWTRNNYPLIKQHELLEKSVHYSICNAQNAWLPQVTFSAQATYQSDVASFPKEMSALYQTMGLELHGLNKDQYRASVELSQILWDGGATQAQKNAAKAEGAIQQANLEKELYVLNDRVNNLYFGILLLDEQTKLIDLRQELLASTLRQIQAGLANGVLQPSDKALVEADLLQSQQQRTQVVTSAEAYRAMLSLLTAHPIGTLSMPLELSASDQENCRPELLFFQEQEKLFHAQDQLVQSSTMPHIGAFAQGFYGNPGLNLFKDMTKNRWTWNYLVGVKIQWSPSAFYNKNNNLQKIKMARQQSTMQKETFLFNIRLQTIEQQKTIERMRATLIQDRQLISLRETVRKATEAKLANGILQPHDLLRDITSESLARIAEATHRIELLKYKYDLQNTLNSQK